MVQYITTLSKYFICLFTALYTLECFLTFHIKIAKVFKGIYSRQIIHMLLFQFSAFLPICLSTGDVKYIFFYIGTQVFLLTVVEVFPLAVPKINRLLINNSAMLIGIGLVILVRLDFAEALKQLIIAVVSFLLGGAILFAKAKIGRLKIHYKYFAYAGLTLLLAVYLLGTVTNGSKLSFSVFGLSFQASEFVKILFVFFVAGAYYADLSLKNIAITSLFAAMHVILLVLTTDLGAALIFFVTYVLMLYIATRNEWYIILGIVFGAGSCVAGYKLFRHVRIRVLAFIDPFSVIDNEGYQITQSFFAISGGGLFGRGLFRGSPFSIPYVETDFIFSAIAEELGFIFALCLVLICISTFLMFVNISFGFMDMYYRLSAIGLGIVYIFQVFVTVGGGTGFIPLTGVTLPLVSYGGSSIMATIFTICLVEGLYATKPVYKDTEENNRIVRGINKRQSGIILRVAVGFALIFLAMMIHLTGFLLVNKEMLFNNPYNPVQRLEAESNIRGNIYSNNYEVLATGDYDVKNDINREYPLGLASSHIVGYCIGSKNGFENMFNYYLSNSHASLNDKILADINDEKTPADNVITTINLNIQQAAFNAMGTYNGSVIVTDPSSGAILAVVSKQDFDPNSLDETFELLDNDKNTDSLSNKAFMKLYRNESVLIKDQCKKKLPSSFGYFGFDAVETSINDTEALSYITPYEMNLMTQAVANSGTLMKPMFATKIENYKRNVVKTFTSKKYGKIYNDDVLNSLTASFEKQSEELKELKFKQVSYKVFGISGGVSASDDSDDYCYFSGNGESNGERITVTVVLDGLGGNDIYAINIAKKIFDTTFIR